ncbi:hypothetical protein BVG81_002460 [Haliangium sp. UPWRP_2]|nr:hypothetical protein BVG81_002460 [Haliangium sp. UPWRP_2]
MASEDRPKMSWRDIDKRRDGASHGKNGAGRGGLPTTQEEARQKQYRAALEAAFEKGELGKLADKLNLTSRGGATTPAPAAPTPSNGSHANASSSQSPRPEPTARPAEVAAATPAASPAAEDKSGKKKVVGKLAEDRSHLRKKLVEAVGRGEISRAAEKFLVRYPIPDDHEVLEQLLEHERESRVSEAIARIAHLLDRNQMPKRSRALCGKLRYIAETSRDTELKQAAQGLLTRLS